MKRDVLGQLERDGKTIYVEEAPDNLGPEACTFKVKLGINGDEVELDLAGIREAKRLLAEGEKRILRRQEQAFLRRNLTLDI